MSLSLSLETAIAEAARSLPDWAIEAFSGALRSIKTIGLARKDLVVDCVILPHHRARVRAVLDCWEKEAADLPAVAIEIALASAVHAARNALSAQSTHLVWTGPLVSGIYLRGTEQALIDVIHAAQTDLIIVTFAAYRAGVVAEAIQTAIDRGVDVTFIGESRLESGGRVSFDPVVALGPELIGRVSVFVWPHHRRLNVDGRTGALHAKCAIADRKVLLVSSANLTDNAMLLNMEMGVLIQGGDLPGQAADQFERLIATQELISWQPSA